MNRDYYYDLEFPFIVTGNNIDEARKNLQKLLDDLSNNQLRELVSQENWNLQKVESSEGK